ncbi:MAG: MFS transporter [Actinomycetota bacterium]|nr:MFS transporter [Actinomycetota bacterium]
MSTHTTHPLPPATAVRALARARSSHWAALPILLAGTFMVVLDFFIVNVALGSIRSGLHASDGAIEWVVAGYALTSAVLLIPAGRAGDRHGRRRVFAIGLAAFTLASAGCGLAASPEQLVAARLVQGGAAAILMPTILSLIGVLYTGVDRARALSAYGMTMGLAAVSGQLIGGALVAVDPAGLGWRGVFLINLPIGVIALAGTRAFIPESRAPEAGRTDLAGTLLVTAGLTAIVLPLVEGRRHGWPLWTWLTLASAPVILAGFAAHQRRLGRTGGDPLLPAGLFAAPGLRIGLIAQLVFWCGQASFFLVLALYLQLGRGLSALSSGLVFSILAVTYLMTSVRAPALTERHGRRVLGAGALILASGHLVLLATVTEVGVQSSVFALAPGLALVGAGMGLGITPLATLILSGLRPEQAGATAGVLATMQNVGSALGVAVIGVVFFGAVPHGFGTAFAVSVAVLAALLIAVAGLSRLLPAPVRS